MKATWIIGLAILATGISACSRTEEDAKKSVAVSGSSQEATPTMDAVPADGMMAPTPTETPDDATTTVEQPDPAAT